MKRILCGFLMIVGALPLIYTAQVKPDGRRAWEHVRYLASDDMKGRKSGTDEYLKAAEYMAQKMQEYGLQPGGKKGSYFQQAEFKRWRNFDPPARLEILDPNPTKFFPGRNADFIPINGTGSGVCRGELVFAGYGLVAKKYEWDDYGDIDVQNKIVVLMTGGPDHLKKLKSREKSLEAKIKTALKKKAVGVILMNVGETTGRRRAALNVKKDVCPENFVVLAAGESALDRIFYLAGTSWRYLVSLILREQRSLPKELSISIEMEAHYSEGSRKAPNVIGILPGIHPELRKEYIIIGGHLDHLGVNIDGLVLNGADDNAASAAVLLELARVFQANRFLPDRTLVFAAWAGEELGLVGSRYYVKHPLFPLEKTAVYINMDMIGTGDKDLYAGGMWEFSDFFDLLKANMQPKFKEKLQYRLAYRGSDHSAFLSAGVTSISLRTGNPLTRNLDDEHSEYHRPGDISEFIDPELLAFTGEYQYDILSFLANTKENLFDPQYHIQFTHKDSLVVDMHCDTIGRFLEGEDLSQDLDSGHIDIPKLKAGAVDLQVFACFVGPPQNDEQKKTAAKRAWDQIDGVYELIKANPDDLLLITSPNDLRQLRGTRKTGILIGIEGGYAIENDLRLLRSFYRGGVRLMTLTHWLHTDWADASGDPEPVFGGLTEFGEKVVAEMNELGMIIDVSHVHDETFWDVIELSKHPVVASHSCCRALSPHFRNLSDDMLKALAKKGGVIGINFAPGFLDAKNQSKLDDLRYELLDKHGISRDWFQYQNAPQEKREAFEREYEQREQELKKTLPPVDVKTVVDHIEHVIKVTGNKNHVGLGSDYDGIGATPEGLEHMGKISAITAELVNRGYKDADIKKILGGNFQRIFNRVCAQKQDSR